MTLIMELIELGCDIFLLDLHRIYEEHHGTYLFYRILITSIYTHYKFDCHQNIYNL